MIFKSLLKVALNVVVVPIEIAKDVVTLGGTLTDKKELYTYSRLKKAQEKLDDALEE